MTAHFMFRKIKRRLLMIAPEDMDRFLKREKTKDVVGLPAYFDMHQRVWPKPAVGIKVKFVSDTSEPPPEAA